MKLFWIKTVLGAYTSLLTFRNAYALGMDWINETFLNAFACVLCTI